MNDELKPCPFCGMGAEVYFVTGVGFCWRVTCQACGASRSEPSLGKGSQDMRCKARVIAKWNSRPNQTAAEAA